MSTTSTSTSNTTTPAPAPLTIVAMLYAKPGKEAELAARLFALVAPSRAEAGCINYDMHQSNEEPGTFIMYENWTGSAALEAHFTMPYMRELGAVLPDLVSEPVKMHYLSMRSTPARSKDGA